MPVTRELTSPPEGGGAQVDETRAQSRNRENVVLPGRTSWRWCPTTEGIEDQFARPRPGADDPAGHSLVHDTAVGHVANPVFRVALAGQNPDVGQPGRIGG